MNDITPAFSLDTRITYGKNGNGTIIGFRDMPHGGDYISTYRVRYDSGAESYVPISVGNKAFVKLTQLPSIADVCTVLRSPIEGLPKYPHRIVKELSERLQSGDLLQFASVIRDTNRKTARKMPFMPEMREVALKQLVHALVTPKRPAEVVLRLLSEGSGMQLGVETTPSVSTVFLADTVATPRQRNKEKPTPTIKERSEVTKVKAPSLPRVRVTPTATVAPSEKNVARLEKENRALIEQVAALQDSLVSANRRVTEWSKKYQELDTKQKDSARLQQKERREWTERETTLLRDVQTHQELLAFYSLVLIGWVSAGPQVTAADASYIKQLEGTITQLRRKIDKLKENRLTEAKIRREIKRVRTELFAFIAERTSRIDELEERLGLSK